MIRIPVTVVLSLCLLALVVSPAGGGTITVSSLGDTGVGSLRQAVIDAASGDTVDIPLAGTITLTSGSISINKDLTITGPGSGSLTIDGNANDQIFVVNGAGGSAYPI